MEERLVTITDLVKRGWNRELLMRIAHMKETPMFRTSPKGKFYVFESKLIEFASTRRIGR